MLARYLLHFIQAAINAIGRQRIVVNSGEDRMAAPITNNNAQDVLRGASKAMRPEQQGQGRGEAQKAAEIAGNGRQDDAVSVSRAAQILSQQPSERGQGVIQSAGQAMELAKGLRALFEGNSGQAFTAQSAKLSPDLMELLKAS